MAAGLCEIRYTNNVLRRWRERTTRRESGERMDLGEQT